MRLPRDRSLIRPRRLRATFLRGAVLSLGAASAAFSQVPTELRYSIDFQGPTIAQPVVTGANQYSDSDILVRRGDPFSPERPGVIYPGAFLARYGACLDHIPGDSCGVEINALSFGRDARLLNAPNYEFDVYVSVDEWAVGAPSPLAPPTPTIFSEATRREAAADVFVQRFVGTFPFQPALPAAVGAADGNGQRSGIQQSAFTGLGVVEPIDPNSQSAADSGDNVDALDLGPPISSATDRIFFSLQAGFPLCNEPGVPLSNSAGFQVDVLGAAANGADVLMFDPLGAGGQGAVVKYATANQLGLDRLVPGSDDVDALMVVDNGNGIYEPPLAPYSWVGSAGTDLVLYSVRCGSDIIDSFDTSGLPITEGDVLIRYAGQQSPTIFIRAEDLGLDTTSRGGPFNDELDGIDFVDANEEPFKDCNMNGVEDGVDIALGNVDDCDLNGVPDICEEPGTVYCTCETAGVSACSNPGAAGEGCANLTGVGGKLEGGGTSSVSTDFLSLELTQLPPGQFALIFVGGTATDMTLGNGRVCVGPNTERLFLVQASPTGAATQGPGILGFIAGLPAPPSITVGSTWGFQAWYRDPQVGCSALGSNFTNALAVTFTP